MTSLGNRYLQNGAIMIYSALCVVSGKSAGGISAGHELKSSGPGKRGAIDSDSVISAYVRLIIGTCLFNFLVALRRCNNHPNFK